jgi:hypothetical protein
MAVMKASEAKRSNAEDAESGAQRAQRKPEKTKDARFVPKDAGRRGRYMSKVKVESKNANREIGVPRGAGRRGSEYFFWAEEGAYGA